MIEPKSLEDLQKLAKDPSWIHLAFAMVPPRPGARLFAVSLEYLHFKPGTPLNEEFQLHRVNWLDFVWGVISVPGKYIDLCRTVAKETGMRIADGIPCVLVRGNVTVLTATRPEKVEDLDCKWFPLNGENVYTIENDKDSLVYNGLVGEAHIREFEEAKIDAIFADYDKENANG